MTTSAMRWFWGHYLPDAQRGAEPYASPLRAASFEGLPPALVLTAEFDPLRDEGESYAARLEAANVACRLKRYDGMIHGFVGMGAVLAQGPEALREAALAVRDALGADGAG